MKSAEQWSEGRWDQFEKKVTQVEWIRSIQSDAQTDLINALKVCVVALEYYMMGDYDKGWLAMQALTTARDVLEKVGVKP